MQLIMAPQARGRGGGRSVAAAEYIPVGVLRKDAGTFPEAELAGLERHGWIRCEWPDHAGSPSFVRVHVLPDDVARNAMPRDSPSLRRALKVVMSAVDKSPEAWEGDFSHSSAPGSQCAGDEESLWYIFNTLDNPDAQVDEVRDWYGREAICRVLASTSGTPIDEAQGVDGLRTALYPFQARTAATMIQREVQPKQMLDPRLQVSHTPTGQEYYYDKEEGNIVREKRLYSEACGGESINLLPFRIQSLIHHCRNPCRDNGLRENPDLFGGHPSYARPCSKDSNRVYGVMSNSPYYRVVDGHGCLHGWPILCPLGKPFSDTEPSWFQFQSLHPGV